MHNIVEIKCKKKTTLNNNYTNNFLSKWILSIFYFNDNL